MRTQRGAALAIGLTLLAVLTLFAVTGMSTATSELVMAGNEQHRASASQAASAGIELAIADLVSGAPASGAPPRHLSGRLREHSHAEVFTTETRYVGEELGLPQSRRDALVGRHFEIRSIGTAARGARDEQVQGVMVMSPNDADSGTETRDAPGGSAVCLVGVEVLQKCLGPGEIVRTYWMRTTTE